MSPQRRVKLFRNGRNQAVHVPSEFELSGDEAILRKECGRQILELAPPQSLLEVLASLEPLDEESPPTPELRTDPVDL